MLEFGVERFEDRRLLAGIAVTESWGSTVVSELGPGDTFTVALTAQPEADVVLLLASVDPTETTVSPSSLRFTQFNWDLPQMVPVSGVDDPLIDGDQMTLITVSVDAESSDHGFRSAASQSVTVTTIDDEVAGFTVSPNWAMVSEAGTTVTLTVVLPAQPVSDVVLAVASGDTGEVAVSSGAALTFTPAHWDVPQTVTLAGVDDPAADGYQTTMVTVSVDTGLSDANFATAAPQAVHVTTLDDDVAGLIVSKTTALVSEDGATDTFTVALTAQPESNVELTLTSDDPGAVVAGPASLTFTPTNWNLPQTVTLAGVDDDSDDDFRWTMVIVAVDGGVSDAHFEGLFERVYVIVADEAAAGLELSETDVSVCESGTTDTFTVRLTSQPNTNVTVTVISSDEEEAAVTPTVLTFTPADWKLPQTVTVTGVDDRLIDGNPTTRVTVSVADDVSDESYAGVADETVSAITMDDDVAGFVLSKTAVTVSESGTSDTFTAVLTAQPGTNVILNVTSGDTGEATASPAALIFTPDDWDARQTVTVTGVDDSDHDENQVVSVTVAVDQINSDDQFDGVGSQVVSATTIDNDAIWHNAENPFDVDGDGLINATDVLIIVNYINRDSGDPALPPSPASSPPHYDVNNDGLCTAIDILMVINYINTHGLPSTSAGEGEGVSRGATAPQAASSVTPTGAAQRLSADVQMAPAPSARPRTARESTSAATLWIGAGEGRDVADPVGSAGLKSQPAPVPRQGSGEQCLSLGQPRRLQLQPGTRGPTADAAFQAWQEDPWDELADTLARDIDRVSF